MWEGGEAGRALTITGFKNAKISKLDRTYYILWREEDKSILGTFGAPYTNVDASDVSLSNQAPVSKKPLARASGTGQVTCMQAHGVVRDLSNTSFKCRLLGREGGIARCMTHLLG